MAEIPVEKKSSMAWLWVLLALIVAALLFWLLAAGDDDVDPVVANTTETEMVETDAPIAADAMPMTLTAILAQPQSYIGQQFSGEVGVSGPLTDRGFWIENDGARMFALIMDEPREVPVDIDAGQRLRISGGTIRAGGEVGELEGAPLDDDTRAVLAEQDVFLIVDEARIEILERN